MEDKFDFHNCGNEDALSFGNAMLKVEKLKETVNEVLPENGLGQTLNSSLSKQKLDINVGLTTDLTRYFYEKWFGEGIDCEILRVGAQGWKKGKIKLKLNVTIEFCPDEPKVEETPENNQLEISPPESPLDDLRRQLLNSENQPHNS
ncbi:KGK domain protein [Tychonema sp. LEGE 07199]|uniref:KGK domain-containing protein n=1 Tax=unclassified Tychonema TaxID=2642144 RepID=UPI001882D922|nr:MULTISPECIES: KGK domain-containing protein [unclassified Tychonema]MBE9122941.1 KGK domain protein [Tychonema sp. LEGE 07199]MBE9131433.1 KGK domain protein [Tychonema sp. LEGE 07196]